MIQVDPNRIGRWRERDPSCSSPSVDPSASEPPMGFRSTDPSAGRDPRDARDEDVGDGLLGRAWDVSLSDLGWFRAEVWERSGLSHVEKPQRPVGHGGPMS